MLINKIDGELIGTPIALREEKAKIEDAGWISNLQKEIRSKVQKDGIGEPIFAADSQEFVESIINSKDGEILLYYYGEDLVGFFELTVPDDKEELKEEYGIEKYVSDADYEHMGVAESFVVLPKYRGNGLQLKMFERMEEIAKERGVTTIIGTVHPENSHSCNNFKVAGYDVVAEIQAHGGPRFLQYKDIRLKERETECKERE